MQHYTCDMCGRLLEDQRFVAHLQLYPAFDPNELTSADLDVDHLQEVADVIAEADPLDPPTADDLAAKQHKFDLCGTCYHRYAQDPLGKQNRQPIHFSEN